MKGKKLFAVGVMIVFTADTAVSLLQVLGLAKTVGINSSIEGVLGLLSLISIAGWVIFLYLLVFDRSALSDIEEYFQEE